MIDWNPESDMTDGRGRSRKTPRIALILIAEIDDLSGHKVRMRVRNLSQTGFGGIADLPHRLQTGQAVKVTFGSYTEIEATIVRSEGANVGLRFDEIVDLDRIRSARVNPPPSFEPLDIHKVKTPEWMIKRAKQSF